MEKLFVAAPSSQYKALALRTPSLWQDFGSRLNRRSVVNDWVVPEVEFITVGRNATQIPDICSFYLPGHIAFPSRLKVVIFPSACNELEFLPLNVDGADWLLLNCLKTTKRYSAQESIVSRGANGEIFLIQKIVVSDESLSDCEVFTIDDSNRGQLIFLAGIEERIKKLGLKGFDFREIGQLA